MLLGLSGLAGSGKDLIAAMIAPEHPVWMNGHWVNIDTFVDEEAAYLRKTRPLRPRALQIALADPIKVIAHDLWNFSYQQLWGSSEKRNAPDRRYPRRQAQHLVVAGTCSHCRLASTDCQPGVPCVTYLSPREALQHMGTEIARKLYADTWIELGVRRAQNLSEARITQPSAAVHFSSSHIINRTDLVVLSDVRFRNEIDAISKAGGKVWRVICASAGLDNVAGAHQSEQEQTEIENDAFDAVIPNDGTIDDLHARVHEGLENL
jgi:hypothetical protein